MKDEYSYFEIFGDALAERGLKITDLEENGIFAKNSFYNLKRSCPTVESAVKFANFVEMSLDYIMGKTAENNFKKYKHPQINFFENLTCVVKSMNVSKRQLTKDLDFSSGNTSKWNRGTIPLFSNVVEICDHLGCSIDDLLETE